MDCLNKCAVFLTALLRQKNNPGKKTVQKLMYLVERKGANLGLNYRIHFFGPYSPKLEDVLNILNNQGVINIDTSGMTHTINIKNESKNGSGSLSIEEEGIVASVIDSFGKKSPRDLEGITTLDFVACLLKKKEIEDEKAIIKEVNRIKGDKFSNQQLKEYLIILKKTGYLQ